MLLVISSTKDSPIYLLQHTQVMDLGTMVQVASESPLTQRGSFWATMAHSGSAMNTVSISMVLATSEVV